MRRDELSDSPGPCPNARRGKGRRATVRFDRAFGSAEPAEEESPGFLARLREAFRSSEDRRGMTRHPVVDREIWVGWWRGDDFGAVVGRLVNLSRSGAMVILDDRPPRREPVWFYREVNGAVVCVRAALVGLMPAPGGAYRARFRFAAYCPTDLCQAILCGQNGSLPPEDPPEPGPRRS